jgi:hypothetical protein
MDEEAIANVANTGCTSVGEPIGRLLVTIDVSMIEAEIGGRPPLMCRGYGVPDWICPLGATGRATSLAPEPSSYPSTPWRAVGDPAARQGFLLLLVDLRIG